MSNDDLWGDIPEADTTTAPVTLLRQQASVLGSKTANVLEGVVSRARARRIRRIAQGEETVELRFYIRCTALDNYTFHVLTLKHPLLTIFPVSIHDEVAERDHVCQSEDELRDALHRIFTSQQLRGVISALLRESRALAC
jgi:hypothetical protein